MANESPPLFKDKFNRAITPPDVFTGVSMRVYKVPTEKGGAPKVVKEEGYDLELPLSMTEEAFDEKMINAFGPRAVGRYVLHVEDKDQRELGIKCYRTIKVAATSTATATGPAPETVAESLLLKFGEQIIAMSDRMCTSNEVIARANASVVVGKRGVGAFGFNAGEDDEVSSLRRQLEDFMARNNEGPAEKELTPEQQAASLAKTKATIDMIAGMLVEHGPKMGFVLDFLKDKLKPSAPKALTSVP